MIYVLIIIVSCTHGLKTDANYFSRSLLPSFPDPTMVTKCHTFTLAQQWESKFKHPGNINSEEDHLRTCKS